MVRERVGFRRVPRDSPPKAPVVANCATSGDTSEFLAAGDDIAELAGVDRPALVCVGDIDPVAPVAAAEEIGAGLRPGVGRLEIIARAVHFPWLDAPDPYWALMGHHLTAALEA